MSGPYGCASRQDVLIAADADAVSEEKDFEAWMACREAKRAKKDVKGSGDSGKQEERKPSEGGRTRMVLIVALGSETVATPVIVSTTKLLSATQKGNRYGGTPLLCGLRGNFVMTPLPQLLWSPLSKLDPRKNRGRRAGAIAGTILLHDFGDG